MSQWRGEPTRPTNPVDTVEALVSPRFALSVIMNIHTISNIKNFKLCKISNQLLLRNLKIKIFSFRFQLLCPHVLATTLPNKFVAIVTKT